MIHQKESRMAVKIVFLGNSGKEAHFPEGNNMVAVCWNIHRAEKKIKGDDGLTYKAEVWERTKYPGRDNDPYIDFVTVRETGDKDESYEDEDSPVDGGLSLKSAEAIATELTRAVAYANSLKKKGK
jgi:hypothetical protein